MKDIIEQYKKGQLNYYEYSEKMFEVHQRLLDYQILLNQTPARQLTIQRDKIVLEIESCGKLINMNFEKDDTCAVPYSILNFGRYETIELKLVMKIISLLDKKSVIFDVGANLGWYTLNFLKQNPQFTCYSFEPIEETTKRLKKNLAINEIETNLVYNFGFYNENKTVNFYYDILASGASSGADLRELDSTQKVNCQVRKMDDFVDEQKISRLDFIKCDVEGMELFVYQGGVESIKRFRPVVFSEMLRKWSAKFGYHPNDIIKLFVELGYSCYVISDNGMLKLFDKVTEETIETNYFFLDKVKHKDIIMALSEEN